MMPRATKTEQKTKTKEKETTEEVTKLTPNDIGWTDYVLDLLSDDEKIKGKKQENISKENNIQKIRRVEGVYPKYELVTSHIGRRSFATNYYGDIPTSYLIYVTGHSSEIMFLNYIGKSNKDMALELTKYF